MIGHLTVIATQLNGKHFHILCDPSSTIGDLKEAIFEFSKIISQQEDALKENAKKAAEEAEKAPQESVSPS